MQKLKLINVPNILVSCKMHSLDVAILICCLSMWLQVYQIIIYLILQCLQWSIQVSWISYINY